MTGQPINLLPIRAAVDAWKQQQEAGVPAEDNLNLASYAAEVLPQLCDEVHRLRGIVSDLGPDYA